jgi:hypothetical protein
MGHARADGRNARFGGRRSRAGLGAIAIALLAAPPARAEGAPDPSSVRADLAARLERGVRPLFSRYCFECHSGAEPKGEVALDRAALDDRDLWSRAAAALAKGDMPPSEKPRPAPEDVAAIERWLDDALRAVDCGGPRVPPRITVRRLNRTEYDNTIRDLFGVPVRAAASFPADDRGYGFDNNADVLTTSPLLLEKYLAAAEKVVAATLVLEDPNRRQVVRTPAAAAASTIEGPPQGEVRALFAEGEVSIARALPVEATYVVRVRAFADQAGPDPARFAIRVDGAEAKAFDVRAARGQAKVYEHRARLPAGGRKIGAAFLNPYEKPAGPKGKAEKRGLYIEWIEVEGPLDAPPAPLPESHTRVFFCAPGPKLPEADCAKRILARFAARAFRRPVPDDELARFLALFRAARARKEGFEASVALAIEAILTAPQFLYRIERDEPGSGGGPRAVSPHELASRLSYFLWSSMPDDALFEKAASGALAAPDALAREVERMIADPKSRALVDGFAAQWLELGRLDALELDFRRFPYWSDDLKASMRRETELFFEAVMRENRSVLDFVDADWTFVDERLAALYGIEGVTGPEHRKVALPRGSERGGLLTQAGILAMTSSPKRTSPTRRGKWILEEILGAPPPHAPPGVPQLTEGRAAEAAAPLRERLARHRTDPDCASCHARMDPIGFALEHFDASGAWRERDGEFAIDASGVLPDGTKFADAAALRALVRARKNEFVRCFAGKMLVYALGRGLEPDDACTLDDIVAKAERGGYRFGDIVLAIVTSDVFTKRGTRRQQP